MGQIIERPDTSLLLTACIDPGKNAAMVVRSDVETRRADYVWSLRKWLANADYRLYQSIVVLDNSGADLSALHAVVEESGIDPVKVELVSIDANRVPSGLHYGFAEAAAMEFAVENVTGVRNSRAFIKATGRLFFPRMNSLLRSLPEDCLAAVDCRSNISLGRRRIPFATTQLMYFDTDYYRRNLVGTLDWFRPERGRTHAENFFFDHLVKTRAEGRVLLRFPQNVDPVGVGAHWNKDYSSIRVRAEGVVRAVSRRVAPRVWI